MDLPARSLKSDNTDEEIIELTDIVKKGTVPDSPVTRAVEEQNSLESQMADLLNRADNPGSSSVNETFDLDALLKASGIDAEEIRGTAEEEATARTRDGDTVGTPNIPDPRGDGHDESAEADNLDMPELGDVDAFLRELVVPEQPATKAEEALVASQIFVDEPVSSENMGASVDASGEEVLSGDDLDALLSSLDDPASGAVPPASSALGTDDAARNYVPPVPGVSAESDEVDDLDALLDSIMNNETKTPTSVPDKSDESKAEPAPTSVLNDNLVDIDSLLNATQADVAQSAVMNPGVENPVEPKMEDALGDLDTLLTEFQVESKMDSTEFGSFDEQGGHLDHAIKDDQTDAFGEISCDAGAPHSADSSAASGDMVDKAEADGPGIPEETAELDPTFVTGDHPLSPDRLDDIDETLTRERCDASGDIFAGTEEFPLEPDLGDPLLVGEVDRTVPDMGAAVLQGLDVLAADIAALQEKLDESIGDRPDLTSFSLLQAKVEHVQLEVQDMAEGYAVGLAAAEARISALEAALAERDANVEEPVPDLITGVEARISALEAALAERDANMAERDANASDLADDIARIVDRVEALEFHNSHAPLVDRVEALEAGKASAQIEDRIKTLELSGEKVAAEVAARVIREEISALLADMSTEGGE